MTFPPFPIADIAATIDPFHVMKLLGEAKALEAKGQTVIHLEIGEPDFPSLEEVHQAVQQALLAGKTHYTPTLGLPELRTKLADFYASFYHATVSSSRILITPGSSTGLHLLLTALLNPQDKVMLADPSYPCNRQFVKLLQGQLIDIPVDEMTDFQLSTELVKLHWQPGVKLVMVATPSNPTGTLIEQPELEKMAHFLAERGAYLLVDEIYQGLVYDRPAQSVLSLPNLPDNVLVINSFSKFFGMTGWRLGWIVAPEFLMPTLDKLAQNLYLAAPTPSQYGALRVLDDDALAKLEQRRQVFEQRRNALYQAMKDSGFKLPNLPQGAFYLYWDVSDFTNDAEAFCQDLLMQTGVVVTPGKDFGRYKAYQKVRIAYTTDSKTLKLAVQKIKTFLDQKIQLDKSN